MIVLEIHPSPSIELLKYCLRHDLAEQTMGDIPSTAKWRFPELKAALANAEAVIEHEMGFDGESELEEDERVIFKLADLLEMQWTCLYERELGNRYCDEIFERVARAIENMIGKNRAGCFAKPMHQYLCERYYKLAPHIKPFEWEGIDEPHAQDLHPG